jgi:hypothetical protein
MGMVPNPKLGKNAMKVDGFLFLARRVRVWGGVRQNLKLVLQDLWNTTRRLSYSGVVSGEYSVITT